MRSLLLVAILAAAAPAAAQDHHGHHGTAPAAATTSWTSLPLLEARPAGRGAAQLRLSNIDAAEAIVLPPEGEGWSVPLSAGQGRFAMGAVGNYHLILVRAEDDATVRVASAAHYFSNPGAAPQKVLAQSHAELQVIPRPLPREHAHYRGGETWRFAVRYQDKPLPDVAMAFQSSNGTQGFARTDAAGVATVVFPMDFPPEVAGSRGDHGRPPSAAFVVGVTHDGGDGRRYVSTFAGRYQPQPFATKTPWVGAVFMAFGMAAAAPLLRRRK